MAGADEDLHHMTIEVNRPYYTQANFNQAYGYAQNQSFKDFFKKIAGQYCPPTKKSCTDFILARLPFIEIMINYHAMDFLNDFFAGITIGIMHIPQALAYGMLANISPVHGLYTCFFCGIVYFFFGTARHISLGNFAVVALMLGNAVINSDCKNYADQKASSNSSEFRSERSTALIDDMDLCKLGVVTAITFMVGLYQIGMSICRLGFVTSYLSEPLTRGLITGAGCHVLTAQLQHVFGLNLGHPTGFLKLVYIYKSIFEQIDKTNVASLVMTVICVLILYSLQRWVDPKTRPYIRMPFPGELLLLLFGTLISYLANFSSKDLYSMKVVGEIPKGLPIPQFPPVSRFASVASTSVAIAIVSFIISISMSKLFATKHGYNIDSNQELFAYGITNMVSSCFSSYVSAAGLSRSLVLEKSGAVSQMACVIHCLVILLVLLYIGPLFRELPNCVLAAVILVNLRGIFLQVKDLKFLSKVSLWDMATWIVTCIAVILSDVDIGMAIGVAFSILSILFRTQCPQSQVLGRIPKTDVYRDVQCFTTAKEIQLIKIFSFSSPLYYGNAEHFMDELYEKTECKPRTIKAACLERKRLLEKQQQSKKCCRMWRSNKLAVSEDSNPIEEKEEFDVQICRAEGCDVRNIILDCSSIAFIDAVGVSTLKQIIENYREVEVETCLARCNDQVFRVIQKSILLNKMVDCKIFLTVHDAVMSIVDHDSSLKLEVD